MNKEEFDKLYKKVEKKLFSYNKMKDKIDLIELEIQRAENDYLGVSGISYDDERTGATNSISNIVEAEAIRREKRVNYLKWKKKDLEIEINKIEIAIRNFTLQEKELFEIYYCSRRNKVTRLEISQKMHISIPQYYKLKKKLVISAINSMYPNVLLDEVYMKLAN